MSVRSSSGSSSRRSGSLGGLAGSERVPPKSKPKKDPLLWSEAIQVTLKNRGTVIEKNPVKYGDHLGHLLVTNYQGKPRAVLEKKIVEQFVQGEEGGGEEAGKTRYGPELENALRTARPMIMKKWNPDLESMKLYSSQNSGLRCPTSVPYSQKDVAPTTTRTFKGKTITCRSTPTMWEQDAKMSREAPEWFMEAWRAGD